MCALNGESQISLKGIIQGIFIIMKFRGLVCVLWDTNGDRKMGLNQSRTRLKDVVDMSRRFAFAGLMRHILARQMSEGETLKCVCSFCIRMD